jgi:hypothetical protein
MNIAVWVAVFTAIFVAVFVPLFQRSALSREKKENDKYKGE